MSKLQTIMTRFTFKCPPLAPLRIASERSILLLRTGYEVLTKYGPRAYAEFKRVHAEAAEFEKVLNGLRDTQREDRR